MASMRLGATLACLGLGGGLRAELQWSERRIVLEPPAGAAEASGEFEFVNRGTTTIRVVDVRADCGCTVLAPEKSVVLPGEKGKIRAVVHTESRLGRQSVAVVVTTNEPELRNYDLMVEVVIKDFATITPQLIFWRVGDEPAAKIFQVVLAPEFRFLGAESSTRDFSVEVAGETDGTVQLRVVPRDAWAKRSGLITVKVAQGGQPPIEVVANVRVL